MSKRAKAKKLSKEHLKCNKPRKTPSHKTKSHVVKACEGGKEKLIRFGQQGVEGAGKNPKTEKDKARSKKILMFILNNTWNDCPSPLRIVLYVFITPLMI